MNGCSLCLTELGEEASPCYSTKLSELCRKYLHSAFINESVLCQSNVKTFPFCPKCFESAEELVDLNEQMEFHQKRISEFIFVLSLEILHRRRKISDFSSATRRSNAGKTLIEFDVFSMPNCDSWNIATETPGASVPLVKKTPEDIFVEFSDPLHIPVLNAAEESTTDIAIEKVKLEDCEQNPIDEPLISVGIAYNNSVIRTNEEMVSVTKTNEATTDNRIPILRLQRLQFNEKGTTVDINIDEPGRHQLETYHDKPIFKTPHIKPSFEKCVKEEQSEDFSNSTSSSLPCYFSSNEPMATNEGKRDGNSSVTNSSEFSLQDSNSNPSAMKSYKCPMCPRKFRWQRTLKSHTETHAHSSDKLINNEWSASLKRKSTAGICLKGKKGRRIYNCDICRKTFTKQYNFNRHRKLHTEGKRLKCDQCHHMFSRADHLESHKRFKHAVISSPFQCRECHKRFKWPGSVKTHYKYVHFALDFSDDCVIKITTKGGFKKSR